MGPLLRSETHKMTTIRAPWLVLGAAVALQATASVLLVLGGTALSEGLRHDAAAQRMLLDPGDLAIFALVLGALVATTDHRHGTIVPTLLVTPRRLQVVGAKAAVTAGLGLLTALAVGGTAVTLGLGLLALEGASLALGAGEVVEGWARAATVMVAYALLGLGIGELLRNQVAAIVVPLVALVALAPLAQLAMPEAHWFLPTGLEQILLERQPGAPIGAALAAALLTAYAAGAVIAGGAIMARRDVV